MKIKLFILAILFCMGCTNKEETLHVPSVGYAVYSTNNNYLTFLVYENNDTIYVGGSDLYKDGKNRPDFEDCTKIKSDKATIDHVISSVNKHLTVKSLQLERGGITCGGGGWLCVKKFYGNGKKELIFNNIDTRYISVNLYSLYSYLEDKHPKIQEIANAR